MKTFEFMITSKQHTSIKIGYHWSNIPAIKLLPVITFKQQEAESIKKINK